MPTNQHLNIDQSHRLNAAGMLLLTMLIFSGCETTDGRSAGARAAIGPQELQVGAGDVVFIVNDSRARAVLLIQSVTEEGLTGITLESARTSVMPEIIRFIPYNEIALLQITSDASARASRDVTERASGRTAIFSVIGALVMGAYMEEAFEEAMQEAF